MPEQHRALPSHFSARAESALVSPHHLQVGSEVQGFRICRGSGGLGCRQFGFEFMHKSIVIQQQKIRRMLQLLVNRELGSLPCQQACVLLCQSARQGDPPHQDTEVVTILAATLKLAATNSSNRREQAKEKRLLSRSIAFRLVSVQFSVWLLSLQCLS